MKIEYSKTSFGQLQKLPKYEIKKVLKKISQLETNPLSGKKLKGKLTNCYSFRAWPYRIVYQINPVRKTIYILIIEHRQSVYH